MNRFYKKAVNRWIGRQRTHVSQDPPATDERKFSKMNYVKTLFIRSLKNLFKRTLMHI